MILLLVTRVDMDPVSRAPVEAGDPFELDAAGGGEVDGEIGMHVWPPEDRGNGTRGASSSPPRRTSGVWSGFRLRTPYLRGRTP